MATTRSANEEWLELLAKVYSSSQSVSPRGSRCRELLGYQTRVRMDQPLVTVAARKLGRRFAVAEAHWILSGKNDVASIAPYSKEISKFSDDGRFFSGAYGVKVVEQLRYVCDSLIADNDTRQAVLSIWRENPRNSKDVPCTLSLQFLIRDGKLHCVASMRSSDVWLGIVYDYFSFSMLSAYILLMLRQQDERLKVIGMGDLIVTAGSQHMYETNLAAVVSVFEGASTLTQEYAPMDIQEFATPEDFMEHLDALKDRKPTKHAWLGELYA